jgi:hypothetical protein
MFASPPDLLRAAAKNRPSGLLDKAMPADAILAKTAWRHPLRCVVNAA